MRYQHSTGKFLRIWFSKKTQSFLPIWRRGCQHRSIYQSDHLTDKSGYSWLPSGKSRLQQREEQMQQAATSIQRW